MGLFDLSPIRKAVRDVAARVRELRGELEKLRRERDTIETAPAARADVKAVLQRQVQAGGERYAELLRGHIEPLIRNTKLLSDPQRAAGTFSMVGATARRDATPTPQSTDLVFYAVAGELVSAALGRVVDAMEWPGDEGLPMAQRAAKLAELDRRIADLTGQEQQLVADANDAGLTLLED